jgi:hypothetical protein
VSLSLTIGTPINDQGGSPEPGSPQSTPKVDQVYTLWSSDTPDATLDRSFSSLQELERYLSSKDIIAFDNHQSGSINWSHLLGHNGILVKGDRHPARRSSSSLEVHAHTSFGGQAKKLEGALEVSAATRIPVGTRSSATAWLRSEIEPPPLIPARIEGGVALTRSLSSRSRLTVSGGIKGVVEPGREGEKTRASATLLAGVEGKSTVGSSTVVRYGAMAQAPLIGDAQGYGAARVNVVSLLSPDNIGPALEFDGVVTTKKEYQVATHYRASSHLKIGISYRVFSDKVQEELHLHPKAVKGLGLNITARLGKSPASPVLSFSGSPFGEGVLVGLNVPIGKDAGISKPFLPHIDPLPTPPELPAEGPVTSTIFTLHVASPDGSTIPLKNLPAASQGSLSLTDIRVKTDSGEYQPLKSDSGGDGKPSLFYRYGTSWVELEPELEKKFLQELLNNGVKIDASAK